MYEFLAHVRVFQQFSFTFAFFFNFRNAELLVKYTLVLSDLSLVISQYLKAKYPKIIAKLQIGV